MWKKINAKEEEQDEEQDGLSANRSANKKNKQERQHLQYYCKNSSLSIKNCDQRMHSCRSKIEREKKREKKREQKAGERGKREFIKV